VVGKLRRVVVIADDRREAVATLTEQVCDLLSKRADEVTRISLAAFSPAMTAEERRSYESDEPIRSEEVKESATAVKQADTMIFIHPTPAQGLTAPVKGWIDRVLVPGVAFVLDDKTGRVRPALGHIGTLGLISIDDRTRIQRWVEHHNAKRVIFRALRLVCGIRTRTRAITLTTGDLADQRAVARRLKVISRW
jgi:putative NADPH-quinone reductase